VRRRSGRRCSEKRKPKGVKGPRAVTTKKWTPGSRILHTKTRRVKFDSTRIVSCKLANGKKIMDHMGSNKNIGKTKGTKIARIPHGGDRKTRPIADHDGRRARRMGRPDRREYTSGRSGVVGGTRVSNPLGTHWRCQPHGAERTSQPNLVPSSRPGQRRLSRWDPGRRRRRRSNASEHSRRLVLSARTPWGLERPHRDAP